MEEGMFGALHNPFSKTAELSALFAMYVVGATYTALKETGFSILIDNMGDKKCR